MTQINKKQLEKVKSTRSMDRWSSLKPGFWGTNKFNTLWKRCIHYSPNNSWNGLDILEISSCICFHRSQQLLYVFALSAFRPNSLRYVLSKVQRWAIHLSRFEFLLNDIEGSNNVFADILTSFSKRHDSETAQTKLVAVLIEILFQIPMK